MKRAYLLLAALFVLSIPTFSQSEAQQVAAAEHARNFQACRTGIGYCDHSLLTTNEAAEIKVAEHSRDVQACRTGIGYCDHSLLTTNEAAEIRVAEHDRNLQACKTGIGYCDHSLLSTEGEASKPVQGASGAVAAPQTPVTTGSQSSSTSAGPICAENGSCYGDPNKNGVPKTVHVDGYYRKDGTYVRGYYRSAPGTNPPKAK